jgi:mono/diheme cytochrome c family protein
MRPTGAPALLALGLALAGCGASPMARPEAGAIVFAQSCAICHSLTGRESPRRQGGDLLVYRMSRSALLQYAAEMPVPRRLSAAQLGAVVDYVYRAQHGEATH